MKLVPMSVEMAIDRCIIPDLGERELKLRYCYDAKRHIVYVPQCVADHGEEEQCYERKNNQNI